MTALLYSNNANIKYPLSDFHEEGVPNSILLNMSLDIPDGYTPVLAVLQVSSVLVYLSIEDETTHELLAQVVVTKPRQIRIYPLEMSVKGSGYVVFGPGIQTQYNSGHVQIKLDPEIVTYSNRFAPALQLTVNGRQYDFSDTLEMLSVSNFLAVTIENNRIYFDRQDSEMSDEFISNLSEQVAGDLAAALYTVGGVPPDEDGLMSINIDPATTISDCEDIYTLAPGQLTSGEDEATLLPLDLIVPRSGTPYYECGPDEVPPGESPIAGEQIIKNASILDVSNDNPVGVLYSTRGDTITSGVIIDGGTLDTPPEDYDADIDALEPGTPEETYGNTLDGNVP